MIFEDTRLPKLQVVFSKRIKETIRRISTYNITNTKGLVEWRDYLNSLKERLADPVIAWDNTGTHTMQNGTRFFNDFGYNAKFTIYGNCVYVYYIDYNLEEFGLEKPQVSEYRKHALYQSENIVNESHHRTNCLIRLTETQLRNIIYESVLEAISNTRMTV